MAKFNENSPLFTKLGEHPPQWWRNLVADKELSIQIRKENYIDVYFNGGGIIKNLTCNGAQFSGEIHYKYIPIARGDGDYVEFSFSDEVVEFEDVQIAKLGSFSKESIEKIKHNINKYYPPDSEKGIQYAFIKHDPFFIDSEFAYNYGNKKIRIDLVRIDTAIKKIVFVEVKTVGDARLYNGEIVNQLQSYNNFIKKYHKPLLSYYKKVFALKKRLKILPEGLASVNIDEYEILKKTLLLFGDCEQKWIDSNSPGLDKQIRNIAAGCYYFGKPNYKCAILHTSKRNQHMFLMEDEFK